MPECMITYEEIAPDDLLVVPICGCTYSETAFFRWWDRKPNKRPRCLYHFHPVARPARRRLAHHVRMAVKAVTLAMQALLVLTVLPNLFWKQSKPDTCDVSMRILHAHEQMMLHPESPVDFSWAEHLDPNGFRDGPCNPHMSAFLLRDYLRPLLSHDAGARVLWEMGHRKP